jgi:hypothetical protein
MKIAQGITACKQYCLAPAHVRQHKATSPTRKPSGGEKTQVTLKIHSNKTSYFAF